MMKRTNLGHISTYNLFPKSSLLKYEASLHHMTMTQAEEINSIVK